MALEKYKCSSNESGFSLAETLVAVTLLATGLLTLAQLFAISTNSNRAARSTTFASVLAEQKIEQLRGLTWGFDILGLPISDTTSNISVSPEQPVGGSGLSPGGSLTQNQVGYVDYVGRFGETLGGGASPLPGTVYIRRWTIEPLPTNPNNTLILQVLVTPFRNRGVADQGSVARMPEEARLVSVKTRKAQ
jgi:type II secretory pathway pseudopilin PulG